VYQAAMFDSRVVGFADFLALYGEHYRAVTPTWRARTGHRVVAAGGAGWATSRVGRMTAGSEESCAKARHTGSESVSRFRAPRSAAFGVDHVIVDRHRWFAQEDIEVGCRTTCIDAESP
jgi:hypothetical protein